MPRLQERYKEEKGLNQQQKSQNTTEQLKKCLTQRFQETKTVLERYQEVAEHSIHESTLRDHLNELEKIGEAESKYVDSHSKAWKQADKPIKEIRENTSSPQSGQIPRWLETRIEQVIKTKLDTVIENQLKDSLADEFEDIVREKVKEEIKNPSKQDESTSHKQEVYKAMEKDEWLSISELMQRYCGRVDDARTQRTIRRYLAQLKKQGKVKSKGSKKARKYCKV